MPSFKITACKPRTCTGISTATPDQIQAAGGRVQIDP